MENNSDRFKSAHAYFVEAVHVAFDRHFIQSDEDVENYLAGMLAEFMRMDSVLWGEEQTWNAGTFRIRNVVGG